MTPPSPRADLVVHEVDGELVVYDPTRELLHHLDATATVVWWLLDGTTPVMQTIDELASTYHTTREQVAPGVDALVARLRAAGLLDEESAGD